MEKKFDGKFPPFYNHDGKSPIKIFVGNDGKLVPNLWEISHRGGKLVGISHRVVFPSVKHQLRTTPSIQRVKTEK